MILIYPVCGKTSIFFFLLIVLNFSIACVPRYLAVCHIILFKIVTINTTFENVSSFFIVDTNLPKLLELFLVVFMSYFLKIHSEFYSSYLY